jgi:hypothetical protein
MNTFTTQDGFTWYLVQPRVAKYLHDSEYYEVYELHDDESESLCEDGHDFSGTRYGIEAPLDNQLVHALCGAELVKVYEVVRDFEVCHEIIFDKRRGDLTFFFPFEKPKQVIDNLRGCDAVTFITSEDFLRIITHD